MGYDGPGDEGDEDSGKEDEEMEDRRAPSSASFLPNTSSRARPSVPSSQSISPSGYHPGNTFSQRFVHSRPPHDELERLAKVGGSYDTQNPARRLENDERLRSKLWVLESNQGPAAAATLTPGEAVQELIGAALREDKSPVGDQASTQAGGSYGGQQQSNPAAQRESEQSQGPYQHYRDNKDEENDSESTAKPEAGKTREKPFSLDGADPEDPSERRNEAEEYSQGNSQSPITSTSRHDPWAALLWSLSVRLRNLRPDESSGLIIEDALASGAAFQGFPEICARGLELGILQTKEGQEGSSFDYTHQDQVSGVIRILTAAHRYGVSSYGQMVDFCDGVANSATLRIGPTFRARAGD